MTEAGNARILFIQGLLRFRTNGRRLEFLFILGKLYIMKKMLCSAVLCSALFGVNTAQAAVVIDPLSGWSGDFAWFGGLGGIDSIAGTGEASWSITASQDSQMTFATAWDAFIPGDAFQFVIDGLETAWSTTYTDGSGYFHGILNNLFLSAGEHLITINVVEDCCGSGGAHVQFSGITASPSAVPVPAAVWLFGSGLAGLLGFNRKRVQSAA
jgi:hypothetical protein